MLLSKADFSKICRMCLLFKREMLTLETSEVIHMIRICINVEVQLNDELPQTICLECSDQLHKYSAFRQLCKNSDEILHKIINDNSDASNDLMGNLDADFLLVSNVEEVTFVSSNVKKRFENHIKDEPFGNEHNMKNIITSYSNHANKNSTFNKITLETNLLTKRDLKDEESFQDLSNFSSSRESEGNESDSKNEDIDHNKLNIRTDSKNHVSDSENSSGVVQGTVNCIICNKYISTNKFENHMKRHRQERKHKCDLCPHSFKMPCQLARHLEITHHRKKKIECQVCNKKFHLQVQLDKHLKSHFKTTPTCNICGRKFVEDSKLRRHKKIHEKREKIYCVNCDKNFISDDYFKIHLKFCYNESVKEKKTCPVCGKTVLNIKIHTMQTHNKNKPFKCDQCSKTFLFNSMLLKHIQVTHLGIKKESKALCSICGKACLSQGDLHKHLLAHDDNRKFSCHLCKKTYKSPHGLKYHLKVHKGIRSYGCSSCSKKFFSKQQLNRHLIIHTGEKPFACNICGSAFNQEATRKTHMKVHNVFMKSNKNIVTT